MKCAEFKKTLKEAEEGKAAPGAEFLEHARGCKKCSAEYMAYKIIKTAVENPAEIKIPADFNSKVWKKAGVQPPSIMDTIFSFKLTPAAVLSAAGAFAAFMFLVLMAGKITIKTDGSMASNKNEKSIVAYAPPAKQATYPKLIKNDGAAVKHATQEAPQAAVEVASKPEENQAAYDGPGKGPAHEVKPVTVFEVKPQAQEEKKENKVIAAAVVKSQTPRLDKPVIILNNVFNPSLGETMHIKYEVLETAKVTIIIYNFRGEPVNEMVNADKTTGIYEEKWDGRNTSGMNLPSGKYIIYIKTGLTEQKIKAAIVK